MSWELQIIRASEFVRRDASEHLDFQASRDLLKTFAQACVKRALNCALMDLRRIPKVPAPQFTVGELDGLVRVFIEAGFTCHQRLAILYKEDDFGDVKKFAFISRMRGFNVQAFNSFEEVLDWLAEESEAEALRYRRYEEPVSITFLATQAQKAIVVS